MVHLSRHDSKKYQAALQVKQDFVKSVESETTAILPSSDEKSYRNIDEFGEIAVRKITHIQKRFTLEEIVSLVEKYLAGKSTRELGKEFGCNRNTVSNVLKRNGVKVRGRGRQKIK